MTQLQITPVVFDCPPTRHDPPGRVLKMTAKRYWTHESASNDEGFSLLFTHCIGSHKEQWEPIIEQTFRMQQSKARHHRVREAWSFDWQSHGDAGVLNRELLEHSRKDGVSAYEWAEAIAAFVRSPWMQGRRIVGIGHSAGAGAIVLSLSSLPLPFLTGLILVEPTIATPDLFYATTGPRTPAIAAATMARPDRWDSREEAKKWLVVRTPWKRWDARVLGLFIEHGLTSTPDHSGSVTLKCTRRHEGLAFPDVHPHFDAVTALDRITSGADGVPVHLVWASRSELVPKVMQDALSNRDGSEGARRFASITRVEGGHLIIQESPSRVAQAICGALDALPEIRLGMAPVERSRL